jgi:two-component system, chemotaxis family, response regulator Rcp1
MSRVLVLMIDDNEDDAELFATVFAKASTGFELSHALDAAEGLARLQADGNRIRLVLLDIKMPSRDGKEVLSEIRRVPSLRPLPVVVFSSSDAPSDVRESYRLGANAYVRKPVDLDGWREFLTRLDDFWLKTATLP